MKKDDFEDNTTSRFNVRRRSSVDQKGRRERDGPLGALNDFMFMNFSRPGNNASATHIRGSRVEFFYNKFIQLNLFYQFDNG